MRQPSSSSTSFGGTSPGADFQHEQWRLLALDAAEMGTWFWDTRADIVHWDEACKRLFGIADPNSMSVDDFFSIIHPDDRAATRTAVTDAIRNRRDYDMIHRAIWADGSVHWLRCKGRLDSVQDPRYLLGVSVEATWLKRMEDVLRISERFAAAADLANVLAHEINNPLEIMCNALYLLNGPAPPEAQQYAVECIRSAYERVEEITRQMLTLGVPRDIHPLDLGDCVELALEDNQEELAARHINLKVQCSRAECFYCSRGDVRRILSILLGNAIDAIERDGTIRIQIRNCRDWSDFRRPGVRITIADNGRGIPDELRSSIFQPFASSKQRRGAGLGLWICRTIAGRYGGTIRFRSSTEAPHSGSCFSVFLRECKPAGPYSPALETVQRLFPAV